MKDLIVSLVVVGIFAILLCAYIIVAYKKHIRDCKNKAELIAVYQSENLAKIDYDFSAFEEASSEVKEDVENSQLTIDEIVKKEEEQEEVVNTIDKEGMEEIKGTYFPD